MFGRKTSVIDFKRFERHEGGLSVLKVHSPKKGVVLIDV